MDEATNVYSFPQPVSSAPVEEVDSAPSGMGEEDLYGHSSYGHLPPPGPRNIIDLPESHSFIVTEVPPDNVMEEDDAPEENTEAEAPAQDSVAMSDGQPPDDAKDKDPPSENTSDKLQESAMDTNTGEPQTESQGKKDAPPEQIVTNT